jgi:hypothetical protein
MVNFIRGDRSNEGTATIPRVRGSTLGDIIHSNPAYVQKPLTGFPSTDYLDFAATYNDRNALVFVGANDGMLHAFDADDGEEIYAYIPSMVISRLPRLAVEPYSHHYYVDGHLTVGDAEFDDDGGDAAEEGDGDFDAFSGFEVPEDDGGEDGDEEAVEEEEVAEGQRNLGQVLGAEELNVFLNLEIHLFRDDVELPGAGK